MISSQKQTTKFFIRCGKGFYIRSFARDLGDKLATKAHISSLKRIKVGKFEAKNANLLDDLLNIRQRLFEFKGFHSSLCMLDDMMIKSLDVEDVIAQLLVTEGYVSVEGIASESEENLEKIEGGKNYFLLNLERSSVVNSIGVSILIEIIEKLQESDGKLGYFNLAPIVAKTFNIMGLTKYSTIYESEEDGISQMS